MTLLIWIVTLIEPRTSIFVLVTEQMFVLQFLIFKFPADANSYAKSGFIKEIEEPVSKNAWTIPFLFNIFKFITGFRLELAGLLSFPRGACGWEGDIADTGCA